MVASVQGRGGEKQTKAIKKALSPASGGWAFEVRRAPSIQRRNFPSKRKLGITVRSQKSSGADFSLAALPSSESRSKFEFPTIRRRMNAWESRDDGRFPGITRKHTLSVLFLGTAGDRASLERPRSRHVFSSISDQWEHNHVLTNISPW